MDRILLVVVFEDEMDLDDINLLMEDLEETGALLVDVFDGGCKIIIEVPTEVPKVDHETTLEQYWMDVINESQNPCCTTADNAAISVYSVHKIADFLKNSRELNDGESPYEFLEEYI